MRLLVAAAVAVACLAVAVLRAETILRIDDPELNARYQSFIHEVRCLVCENRSIAESPSDVAQDLKRVILEMIVDGKSDAEIADFLVARYGDTILYRPPMQPNTWVLWGGPAVLLLIGGLVFAQIVRTRREQPIDEDDAA